MLPTLVISLREFLEVFLIIGVFLGVSKKLNLHREKEIILASALGISISLILPVLIFLIGDRAQIIFNEQNAELIEGYLMIFSGFFIAYVVFSLHKFFVLGRSKTIIEAHEKMKKNIFDLALFATIVFFIIREGFEIALFTGTTSLFSKFSENISGLLLGFGIASILGLITFFAYTKFPIGKVFKITEYMIILLGAAFVKNGLDELAEVYFDIHLSNLIPIKLSFLPSTEHYVGHFLHNMTGLEQNFSLVSLGIMLSYFAFIYFLFFKKNRYK